MKIEFTEFKLDGTSSQKARVLVNGNHMLSILLWENKYHVFSNHRHHRDSRQITAGMKQKSFNALGAAEETIRTAITDFYQTGPTSQ